MNDVPEVWQGLRWPGATVVILASGPSLTPAMCEEVCGWRERDQSHRVIAINTTFRLALWADVLYACDVSWWTHHFFEATTTFRGELWTQDRKARDRYGGIRWIESLPGVGLSRAPGVIHQGMNGGYQAINLAYQAQATKLILLGYDMRGGHWHGRHPLPLTNTTPDLFRRYIERFVPLAADLKALGVEVVNCTPGSALTAFPMGYLSEMLA